MKLVHFDYSKNTVTVTETIGNVIYLKIISWREMQLLCLENIHGMD